MSVASFHDPVPDFIRPGIIYAEADTKQIITAAVTGNDNLRWHMILCRKPSKIVVFDSFPGQPPAADQKGQPVCPRRFEKVLPGIINKPRGFFLPVGS